MVTSRSFFFFYSSRFAFPFSLSFSASLCLFLCSCLRVFREFCYPVQRKKRSTRVIVTQKIIVCWKNKRILISNFCSVYFRDASRDSSSGNRLRCTDKSGRHSLCTLPCVSGGCCEMRYVHFTTSRPDCFIVISDYLSTRMQSVR